MNKRYITLTALVGIALSFAMVAPTFAKDAGKTNVINKAHLEQMKKFMVNHKQDIIMMAQNPLFEGDGNPVVMGTVSAVNANTVTITNKSNVTYTINAGSAKISQNGKAATLSNVAVGDIVIVQGNFNGTSVSATSLIDIKLPPKSEASSSEKPSTNIKPAPNMGMGLGVVKFFRHLFGF